MPDDIEVLATELDNGANGSGQEGRDVQDRQDGTPDQGDRAESEGQGQDEGPDEVIDEPRRPSRANARIERLIAERNADKERADRLERQVEELRVSSRQSQTRQESPEEEQARLSLMTAEQRLEYKLDKSQRTLQAQIRESSFQAQELADKNAFENRAQTDKLYARFAPEVEAELSKLRSQGQNVPRQVLLELAVGRAALAARGKVDGAKKAGAANLRKETTSPLNGKADTQARRRNSTDTPAKRLDGVSI